MGTGFLACTPCRIALSLWNLVIVFGAIAAAVDRQVAWAYAMLGTVVLNIALNAAAIPYFQEAHGNGGIGVAGATLVSESVMVLIAIALVPKNLFTRHLATMGARVAACGGVMALAVSPSRRRPHGVAALLGVAALGAPVSAESHDPSRCKLGPEMSGLARSGAMRPGICISGGCDRGG